MCSVRSAYERTAYCMHSLAWPGLDSGSGLWCSGGDGWKCSVNMNSKRVNRTSIPRVRSDKERLGGEEPARLRVRRVHGGGGRRQGRQDNGRHV